MRTFQIELIFDENGKGHVSCTDVKLSRKQLKTLTSFPAYYDKLILTGYTDGNDFYVKTCITKYSDKDVYITHEDFYDIIYEAINSEWLINEI